MSRSVNRITLLGNVGAAPEIRTTGTGKKVANFSLATSWSRDGKESTDWHRCSAWGKVADIIEQYVGKGDRLYLEGRMSYGSYERDGVTIPTADVVVFDLTLLSPKRNSDVREPAHAPGNVAEPDGDLPFAPLRLTNPAMCW